MSPVAHRFSVWAYNKKRRQWELHGTSRTASNAVRMADRLKKKLKTKTKVVDRQKPAKRKKARRRTPPHKLVTIFGRKGVFIDWAAWTRAKETAAHHERERQRVERLVDAARKHTRLMEDQIAKFRAEVEQQKQTMGGITDTAEQTARIVTDPAFWRMIKDAGVELSVEDKRKRALLNAGYGLEDIDTNDLLVDKDRFLTALRAAGSTWHAAYQAWFGYA